MVDDEDKDIASAFVDRLRSAVADTPQAVVAKRSRISTSAFSKLFQGTEPGLFKAARIAKVTGVSLDWLATGVGSPNATRAGFVEVPILDVRLAAGAASLTDAAQQIGVMPFDMELLRSLGRTSADGLVILEAEGDSMEPIIADGARVLADTTDTRLREGIFAFRIGDELRVKRLRRLGTDAVEVLSENPRYEPEVLSGETLDHFAILGRVRWAATSL
ncbi:LexA family transcriptional regulator [Brevundimonas sp.]|uniref:LexA family transcriptional regulator n=1 Tax=Brevundimonas sp. TaxID=1871086 RepID=UPI0025C1F97F|nr:LexA family transcriptional regulator [Brevundimonas sp.]MCG2663371.1 helix-turn-helix domain-containing protein [Brevundimonas sp.]